MVNNGWNVTVPLSSLGTVGTALGIRAMIFKMGREVITITIVNTMQIITQP